MSENRHRVPQPHFAGYAPDTALAPRGLGLGPTDIDQEVLEIPAAILPYHRFLEWRRWHAGKEDVLVCRVEKCWDHKGWRRATNPTSSLPTHMKEHEKEEKESGPLPMRQDPPPTAANRQQHALPQAGNQPVAHPRMDHDIDEKGRDEDEKKVAPPTPPRGVNYDAMLQPLLDADRVGTATPPLPAMEDADAMPIGNDNGESRFGLLDPVLVHAPRGNIHLPSTAAGTNERPYMTMRVAIQDLPVIMPAIGHAPPPPSDVDPHLVATRYGWSPPIELVDGGHVQLDWIKTPGYLSAHSSSTVSALLGAAGGATSQTGVDRNATCHMDCGRTARAGAELLACTRGRSKSDGAQECQ